MAPPLASDRLRSGPAPSAGALARRARRKAKNPTSIAESLQRVSLIGLFLGLVVYALSEGASLFGPILLAIVFGLMFGPLVGFLQRRGVPNGLGALLVLMALVGTGYGLYASFSQPVTYWVGKAPEMVASAQRHADSFSDILRQVETVSDTVADSTGGATDDAIKVVEKNDSFFTTMLSTGGSLFGQIIIFVGTLYFYLANRNSLRDVAVGIAPKRGQRLTVARVYRDSEYFLSRYFATVTLINIGLGLVVYLAMWAIGFPAPALVGMLAAVMNFIPYVGPALVGVIVAGIGLVESPTLLGVLAPVLVFFAIQLLEGNFVTPSIVGKSLSLNPFFVFLSIAAWMWLWGPLGAFLASPVLVIGYIALVHSVDRMTEQRARALQRTRITRKVSQAVTEKLEDGVEEVKERLLAENVDAEASPELKGARALARKVKETVGMDQPAPGERIA